MKYFSAFPKLSYDNISISDIFKRVSVLDIVKNDTIYYNFYRVEEGETPDSISEKIYSNPNLYWIIFLTNNILNPQYDWPLTTSQLEEYLNDKYGENINDIHHYVTTSADIMGKGVIVSSTYAGNKIPITNYEYEVSLNDSKRILKIIKPEYLTEIISEFKEKIK